MRQSVLIVATALLAVAVSHSAVAAKCNCPNDTKSNGARCGKSSAFCKPGGKTPSCPGQSCSSNRGKKK